MTICKLNTYLFLQKTHKKTKNLINFQNLSKLITIFTAFRTFTVKMPPPLSKNQRFKEIRNIKRSRITEDNENDDSEAQNINLVDENSNEIENVLDKSMDALSVNCDCTCHLSRSKTTSVGTQTGEWGKSDIVAEVHQFNLSSVRLLI